MQKSRKAKFILGVTGNIGCGKSTVAGMFKTKDCLLIDTDKLAHRLLSAGSQVYEKIKKYFGPQVLRGNHCVDRKKLAEIVFNDRKALAALNRIVHPELIRQIKQRIRNTEKRIIILDAALIVEAGLTKLVDKLVVVTAASQQQLRRSQKRLGLNSNQVAQRMKSQISQKVQLGFADFIIDNRGQLSQIQEQVSKIRRQLWKS